MHGFRPVGQAGFSLIELSVATAVYSMGLGGLALMLLLALQGTTGARLDTVAAIHAASLAETIAMTSDAAGHYLSAIEGGPGCDAGQTCTPEAMAASGLASWRRRLEEDLPQGVGLVCLDATPDDGDAVGPSCDGGGGPVIKVFWELPAEEDGAPTGGRHVLQLPLL